MADGQSSEMEVAPVRRSRRVVPGFRNLGPATRFSRREESVSPSSRDSSRSMTPVPRGTGIATARAELIAARKEAREEAFNQLLKDRIVRKEVTEPVLDPDEGMASGASCREDPAGLTSEELRASAGRSVAAIMQMASRSHNLKGTFVRRFKEAASELQEIVEALASRTEADETRGLRADNARLRTELESVKAELKAHRREFSEMRTAAKGAAAKNMEAPPLGADLIEELKASIVASVGVMLDARFAGIEERLLPQKVIRPPLSSDSRRSGTSQTPASTHHHHHGAEASVASPGAPPATAGPSGATPVADSWATVVGRKAKKASRQATSTAATPAAAPKTSPAAATKKDERSLAPHKNAAVIITVTSDALKKGVTYAQVLELAEQKINLQDLGIGAGFKIRRAATGARLLELPQGQTQEQAEALAVRLQTALEGVAEVNRPTKTVTLKVTGLDDSATAEKIATAVAQAGGCLQTAVKVSEVQPGLRGVGSAIVYCPVDAAKKVCDSGRLLVGWSSAGVRALEQRPLRCFRCMSMGHTGPVCPSKKDRSRLCFRCGGDGHKAAGCVGTMRCAVCGDAGLSSGHIMGSNNCCPPSVKGVNGIQSQASERQSPAQEDANMSS
ncbi:uncharacterized protein LOC128198183 [Bicyclus anynana]|uniref:Uncharacterized protein LOC128198183 n=1 Tax=Bicyclus anynana TaxID=110368 RepID=A0ABM3LGC9_BICAN|nr:uncharacterized protein LOC128198183 [Bicyclus anynana]